MTMPQIYNSSYITFYTRSILGKKVYKTRWSAGKESHFGAISVWLMLAFDL
jgi:hypothetical protein